LPNRQQVLDLRTVAASLPVIDLQLSVGPCGGPATPVPVGPGAVGRHAHWITVPVGQEW